MSSMALGDLGFLPLSPEMSMSAVLIATADGHVLEKWFSTEDEDAGGFLRLSLPVVVLVRVGFFPVRVLLWSLAAARDALFLLL